VRSFAEQDWLARRPVAPHLQQRARAGAASAARCRSIDEQVTIAELQTQLSQALQIEDYKLAARIRDDLQ
jgi:protein-arginine kinase activator protein McsA